MQLTQDLSFRVKFERHRWKKAKLKHYELIFAIFEKLAKKL